MKYCHDKNDIPEAPHFAALITKSVTIPGDERSRSAPGHGYPEHIETSIEYIAFARREEMEEWVKKQEASQFGTKNYRIIEAFPRRVTTSVSVEVG